MAFAGESKFDSNACKKVAQNKGWTKTNAPNEIDYSKFTKGYTALYKSKYVREEAGAYQHFKNSPRFLNSAEKEQAQNKYLTVERCVNLNNPDCTSMQVYCSQKIATNTMLESYKKIERCSKPWNRPHCGDDYQTSENLTNQLNFLNQKKKELDDAIAEFKQWPGYGNYGPYYADEVREYYADSLRAYEAANARIKLIIEEIRKNAKNLSEEELEQMATEQADRELREEMAVLKTKDSNMSNACDVINKCGAAINNTSYRDQRDLLGQVRLCQNDIPHADDPEIKKLESFLTSVKTKAEGDHLISLTKKTNSNLVRMNVGHWAMYFKSMHGRNPTEADLERDLPKFNNKSLAKKYLKNPHLLKELEKIEKIDIETERKKYNELAYKVNQACKAHVEGYPDGGKSYTEVEGNLDAALKEFNKCKIAEFSRIASFADSLTPFDRHGCVYDKKGLTGISSNSLVREGFNSLNQVYADKAEDIQKNSSRIHNATNANQVEIVFKDMLRNDTLAVKATFAENNNELSAKWICHSIYEIGVKDYADGVKDDIVNGVVYGGAAIATLMTGGAAALVIGGVSTAVGAANAAENWYEASEERANLEGSYVIESKDRDIIIAELEAADLKAEGAILDLALSIIPMAAGSATKMIKIGGRSLPEMYRTMKAMPDLNTIKFSNSAQELLRKAIVAGNAVTPKMLTGALSAQLTKVGREIPWEQKHLLKTFRDGLKNASKETVLEATLYASLHKGPPAFFSEEGMNKFLKSKVYSNIVRNGAGSGLHTLKGELEGMKLSKYSSDGIEFTGPVYTPR